MASKQPEGVGTTGSGQALDATVLTISVDDVAGLEAALTSARQRQWDEGPQRAVEAARRAVEKAERQLEDARLGLEQSIADAEATYARRAASAEAKAAAAAEAEATEQEGN